MTPFLPTRPNLPSGVRKTFTDKMRTASRLLASVKPPRFLEAGSPTGLTGLYTHRTPRSTLLYLYNVTLDKLKAIPAHSVYRQSVERITQHRMSIVDLIKPHGYDQWAVRAKQMLEEHPEIFHGPGSHRLAQHGGLSFVVSEQKKEKDELPVEWDGEEVTETLEGPRYAEELVKDSAVEWEPEPPLEAHQ